MDKFAILTLAVLTCATQAQSLVPPEQPIHLVTEIGQLDSAPDKLRISVNCTLTTNQITTVIQLNDTVTSKLKLALNPTEVPAFLDLLQSACGKLSSNQDFAGKAGRLSVSIGGAEGQMRLLLKFAGDSATQPEHQFTVDARNATQLVRVLARGKQVADWFSEKLKMIQPESTQH